MTAVVRINNLQETATPTVQRPPRIARNLHEPAGWLFEMAQIYRCARRGQLATDDASRLAYLCSQAGRLAKDVEELKRLEGMAQQLDQIEQQRALPSIDYGSSTEPVTVESES